MGINKKDFENIWDIVILAEIAKLKKKHRDIYFNDNSKNEIFDLCNELINYCEKYYVKDPDKTVDRYTICSCIIIAILKVEPIKYLDSKYYDDVTAWLFNEKIALTAALSVLKAFMIECAEQGVYKGLGKTELANLKSNLSKTKNGIVFPKIYKDSFGEKFLFELYCTKKESAYNILALANEFFFLERNTVSRYIKSSN